MKQLRKFLRFDSDAFFEGKDVRVLAHEPWNDYEDGRITEILGTKYKCVIAVDNTDYENENLSSNLNGGEQVVVKVPGNAKEYVPFSRIKFVNAVGVVYGQYQNELSLTAEDVTIQEPK